MSIIEILTAIFANIGQTNKLELKFFTEIFELLFFVQGQHNFENSSHYSSKDKKLVRFYFFRVPIKYSH